MQEPDSLARDIAGSLQVGPQIPGRGGTIAQTQPQGTGYFSVVDAHELDAAELANSNLVLGADGFVYQPTYSERYDASVGGFVNEVSGFQLAPKWLQDEVLGTGGGTGRTGPTAAELAIQRSQVQAQNLSTFISGTIAELSNEIDAGRLETDQALGEFNKRLDAFNVAGTQFQGIQPFTVTPGAKYLPGREPGGVGERLGRPILEASPVMFDPFAIANQIVSESQDLTEIGAPSGDALAEAVAIARGFVGG